MNSSDTIVAQATPIGGAIAIIRLSGDEAFPICDAIFRGKKRIADADGYSIVYGRIVDAEGKTVDDVLVSVFRAPHSYTGENSVEISCHASSYITSTIFSLLIDNGARSATPGEYTSRAFLAGKLDLAQAEAVADIIASDSRSSHSIASTQMRGAYSKDLELLRAELLKVATLLELELDFSEEDVEFVDRTNLTEILLRVKAKFESLIDSFKLGNAIKSGVNVAIVGAPNAGKSTLLNTLLGEERAMVSDVEGTTRDAIEVSININGVKYRFIDTAGIRATSDVIEKMGIDRTFSAIARAQIVIQVVDSADKSFTPLETLSGQVLIVAVNKTDKNPSSQIPNIDSFNPIYISAKTGDGIDVLRTAISRNIDSGDVHTGDVIVSNIRHYEALKLGLESLLRTLDGLSSGLPTDLVSQDLRQTTHHIGEITGEITSTDILQNIFSNFCIGK